MDVALSRNGRRVLRVFFVLLVTFLYAPIAILLIFSFNDSDVPAFPLSGFTTQWYRDFASNPDLKGALVTSALVALMSSAGGSVGIDSSLWVARARYRSASSSDPRASWSPATRAASSVSAVITPSGKRARSSCAVAPSPASPRPTH